YIYNITIKVENHRVEEWKTWMKTIHISDVLATGYFTDARLCHLMDDGDPNAETFVVQYTCNTIDDFEKYHLNNASQLQQEGKNKFGDDFIAFRTFMEII
ncbi:MAG: DUF4286 family protein, partial [Chitinophagales bacterium]